MCGHIIDWVVVRPHDDILIKSTATDLLESDHYFDKSYFNASVSKRSNQYWTARNMANIHRPSYIAENSSITEFSSVENAISTVNFCALCYICMHPLHCEMLSITTLLHGLSQ